MKFTIKNDIFLKTLENIESVVEKKSITPILSNVRLQVTNDILLLNGTDMDLDIVETITVTNPQEGTTTASIHKLYETINNLPKNSSTSIELIDDKLHITCDRFKGYLNTISADEFPIISTDELPINFYLPISDFKLLLEKTKFAISQDDTRYYLNGVYFHITEREGVKIIRGVATDGHRLALTDIPTTEGSENLTPIIIPKKAVEKIFNLLSKTKEEKLKISSSNTKISFNLANLTLTSKLIDGTFPDYKRVIPTNNTEEITIDKQIFISKIKLVSTYSDEKLKGIKFNITKNTLNIIAENIEGQAEEEIALENEIADLSIAFNSKYILEICEKITTDKITILLSSSNTPALIKTKSSENELYVLMPMRI